MRARTPFLHWLLLFAVLAGPRGGLDFASAQAAPPEFFECVSGGMRRGLTAWARLRGIESWNISSLTEDLGPRLQGLGSERPRTLKIKTPIRLDGGLPGQTYRSPRRVHHIFTPDDTRAYEARISQLAESGYLLSGSTWSRGGLEVEFTFNPDVLPFDSIPPPLFALAPLRQKLEETFRIYHNGIPPSAAGDLEIGRDPGTGRPTVTWINNRSDTYQPSRETLPNAVEALWRQGIYPPDLKLLNWDRQEVFLRLRANP